MVPTEELTSQMAEEQNEKRDQLTFRMARFSLNDVIKFLTIFAMIVAAWARSESNDASMLRRIEVVEMKQEGYVRADVAQARNETLVAKIDAVHAEIQRLEMQLQK